MWEWLPLCVGPAIVWRPVQGAFHLPSYDSWDRLQPPSGSGIYVSAGQSAGSPGDGSSTCREHLLSCKNWSAGSSSSFCCCSISQPEQRSNIRTLTSAVAPFPIQAHLSANQLSADVYIMHVKWRAVLILKHCTGALLCWVNTPFYSLSKQKQVCRWTHFWNHNLYFILLGWVNPDKGSPGYVELPW